MVQQKASSLSYYSRKKCCHCYGQDLFNIDIHFLVPSSDFESHPFEFYAIMKAEEPERFLFQLTLHLKFTCSVHDQVKDQKFEWDVTGLLVWVGVEKNWMVINAYGQHVGDGIKVADLGEFSWLVKI